MDPQALKQQLKEQIITQLTLEEVKVEDIADDKPVFGEGLGLDSSDALELIVLLERHYGIKVTDPKQGQTIFRSVNTMAEFIQSQK